MSGFSKLLAAGALVAGLLLPAQAMAAYQAHSRVDLNLRIGPSVAYGVIDVIPAGHPVVVIGCLQDLSWCDVDFVGLRGWVAARYLVQPGTAIYLPQWAPRVGLPVISFSFSTYHDRHYRGRPWHRQRVGHWRGHREVKRPRQRQREVKSERRPRVEQRQRRTREVTRERRPRAEQRQRRPRVEQRQRRTKVEQRQRRPRAEQRQRSSRAIQQRGGPRAERQGRGRGGEKRKRREYR